MFNLIKTKPSLSILRSMWRFSSAKQQQQSRLASLINQKIKNSQIKVQDISEGASCGVMYNIFVESESFKGKSLVEQHQMITNAIKGELKTIHAINIKTKAIQSTNKDNNKQSNK